MGLSTPGRNVRACPRQRADLPGAKPGFMSPEARDRDGDRDRDREVASTSILVVDDQPAALQAMEALLADLAEVVLAGSGPQALRCCLGSAFAVILLDVR